MPRRIPGSTLEALASRAGRCVQAPGALEGGCGGEGRGTGDLKGNLGLHVGCFFAVVFQYRFEDVLDRLIERFWPCLGA